MPSVNKLAIAIAFSRAAESYSQHDSLQRCSAKRLRMLLGTDNFATVLDAGCGPGGDSLVWRASGSQVTALDLSLEMIEQARKLLVADTYLVADIEALPLLDASFDLVWSHLAVLWCNSLLLALSEVYRVVRPGGIVAFTTLLDRSLLELRQACLAIDDYPYANRFLSLTEVVAVLSNWQHRYTIQNVTLDFNDAIAAIRSLKGVGATHLHYKRSRKLLTRSELRRLDLAWPQRHGLRQLTYLLFHGIIKRD